MYPFDAISNFGYGAVSTAPSPADSGTTVKMLEAQADNFPDPATSGQYNVVVWPTGVQPLYSNSEIVRFTAKGSPSGGEVQFTIEREQESTPARTIVVGDQMALAETIFARQQIFNAITSGFYEDKLLQGQSFTRNSATQFKTPGNKTSYYVAGRLIKFHDGSLAIVSSSSYSAPDTTVDIVTGSGAVPTSPTNVYIGTGRSKILDEDNLISNSDLIPPSQQSVKAYADQRFSKLIHQVYLMGDSLTAAATYPSRLLSDLGSTLWNVVNRGINSQTTAQMLSRFNVDILANGNAEYVVIYAGINDVMTDVSDSTIETNLQAMYDLAHDAGLKVIAVNITPFKGEARWSSGRQTVLDTVNTWIANTATNIDYKIDMYSLLEDPGTADTLLATYDSGDHLHLSTAGYQLVADTIFSGTTWDLSNSKGIIYKQTLYDEIINSSSIGRQMVINGGFDRAQRGTSFTNLAAGKYFIDRWRWSYGVDGGTDPSNIVLSRQDTTPGELDGSRHYLRINVDGAGSGYGTNSYHTVIQPILNATRLFAGSGKKVSFSFYAKSNIANKKLGFGLSQNYGTGGSPSSGEVLVGTSISLTSYWKRYTFTFDLNTLAGKTFGTNKDDNFLLFFGIQWGATIGSTYYGGASAETFVGSGNIEIAMVNGNEGEFPFPFLKRSVIENNDLCDFFFQRYGGNGDQQPNQAYHHYANGQCESTTHARITIQYRKKMRITPTRSTSGTIGVTTANGGTQNATNFADTIIDNETNHLDVTVASGLAAGDATRLLNNNDAAAYIDYDAEI